MLHVLHQQIASRCSSIAETHGNWPCRSGCDECCRRLAAEPELTQAEFDLLREGLDQLPPAIRDQAIHRLAQGHNRVCPLLDQANGACLVYVHRPIACRTYGFYVERGKGLYCDIITNMDTADVVWGNAESVETQRAAAGGPSKRLSQWIVELTSQQR